MPTKIPAEEIRSQLSGISPAPMGDERLLHIDHWREIHRPTYWQTFNDGRDAVLVWRQ